MPFAAQLFLYSFGLLVGMLIMATFGHRMGRRRMRLDPDGARAGTGPVEGAAFGLYGLLIAFTFAGAAGRFDQRRQLVVEEANDIGTAYLRLDLLPAEPRAKLQEAFRNYLDARLAIYEKLPDLAAARAELERSNTLQSQIWTDSVQAAQGSQAATMLLLPALNAMIDITTTRTAATLMHPHPVIPVMMFIFALGCAMLVGYSMSTAKRFNWLHTLAFVLITSGTVYIIMDLEYPRMGLLRVSSFDQVLVDLRATMK